MYIRTKSKIYETESPFLDNNGKWVGYNIVEDDMAIILRCQVIREADTIEELCDEFVGVDKTCENGHQLLRAIPYKCANFWNGGVSGAVWVDGKGLIYVAKMNQDGDLELI